MIVRWVAVAALIVGAAVFPAFAGKYPV